MQKKLCLAVFVAFIFMVFGSVNLWAADFSNWPTATPPPAGTLGAPGSIVATPGDGQVVVVWAPVTGATGYKLAINDGTTIIYEKMTAVTYTATGTITSGTKTITVTNGSELQFKVATANLDDEDEPQYGAYSSAYSATPTAGVTTTTTPTVTTTTPTVTTTAPATTTTTVPATTTTTTVPPLPSLDDLSGTGYNFDVNGDGEVNALDAALIIRYLKLK